MMPRRKRRVLILSIILVILLILLIVFLILYNTTDMFKSNDVLFNKYAKQLFDNTKNIFNQSNMSEMNEILSNNKLEADTSIGVKYDENGNTDNPINNIQMNIEEKKDETSKYDYRNVSINQTEEKLLGVEYIQEDNVSGIRLNGIKQFVSTNIDGENDNRIVTLDKLVNTDIVQLLGLSDEEFQTLKDKYIGIITSNISISNYSKKSGVVLEINGSQYTTNQYSITITKEKFNDIYVNILEELQKDEIILSKIENIDNKINEYYQLCQSEKASNYKQQFIDMANTTIEQIKNSNIGNDERTISIFETNGTAISLSIDTENYFLGMDVINTNESNFINILGKEDVEEEEKENSFDFKVQKNFGTNNEEININFDTVEEGEKTTNEFVMSTKMENSEVNSNFEINRNANQNSLAINMDKNIKIVNDFEEKEELDSDDNNIVIDDLDESQKESVRNSLNQNFNNQANTLLQVISLEDINNMLINLNLKEKEAENISDENVTEAERVRFNSNFEFYQGEGIEKDRVLELINVSKDSLEDVRITQYDERSYSSDRKIPLEYKLIIQRGAGDADLAQKLINYIEESSNTTFNIRLEYDETTNLIANIYITVER